VVERAVHHGSVESSGPSCRICGSSSTPTGAQRLLARHDVEFFLCDSCGFWFTEEPWWLEEAYDETVSRMDTGSARRSIQTHATLLPVLHRLFGPGPFVDWAGGTGLLVRLMRDSGLDFHWQDAYAANVYAAGFEWRPELGPAAAVTAIEVFEHLPDPPGFVQQVLDETGTDSIVFAQELHHGPDPDWWYLARETGQHVAFYSADSLRVLGASFGLELASANGLHLLSRQPKALRRFAREVRCARLRYPLVRRRLHGLTEDDAARAAAAIRDYGSA
jgi:hypothetical protein